MGSPLIVRVDQALKSQAWLLSLKKPETRPWRNLSSYLREHRCEMSQSDAEFIAERYSSDCVALSIDEKELMSMFLERHLFWLFKSKVDISNPLHLCLGSGFLTTLLGGSRASQAESHGLLF